MYSIKNHPDQRTIVVTLSGALTSPELHAFAREYRTATDSYRGELHLVLADMRGMLPLSPEGAELLGATIAYARARGVARCAHLGDDAIAKLQTSRLARAVDPQDRVTVHVVSLDEGHSVLAETRLKLRRLLDAAARPRPAARP